MRWSPDDRRLTAAALAAGAGALGILAAWQGFAWSDTRSWVPDLLAGWTLSGLGVATFALGRSRGAAVLLFASGVGWFVGDFHATDPHWVGWLASHLSWLFLAPLVQLALAYPSGRPRTQVTLATTTVVWLAAATPWVDWNDDTTLAVGMATLVVVALGESLRVRDEPRAVPREGVGALLLLLLWALVVPRLTTTLEPITFDSGVALVGALLFAGLHSRVDLAERAIELDETTATLRDALAELLHDPGLQVGFATEQGELVDELGRTIEAVQPGRRTTELASARAVVVHHPAVLAAPEDRKAVAVAAALAATRARLRQDLRRRAEEVSRSMTRLIRSEDDERMRLASQLEASTAGGLADVARLVGNARLSAAGEPELEALLDRAAEQLDRAEKELASLAAGLGVPALLAGLPSALGELVAGLPLRVELHVAEVDLPDELAATIWFVCAEGVANVLKHARASHLVLEVADTGAAIGVHVEDDGRGGADAAGSGLGGLRDRVAALGGTLDVWSRHGRGTRLVATLPRFGALP
ncbi:MAG: sensor histidine kinase [Gaiellaceae bacterium]